MGSRVHATTSQALACPTCRAIVFPRHRVCRVLRVRNARSKAIIPVRGFRSSHDS
ncbi:MAG: hypothetical protein AB8B91_12800 [Rubripirellula sp.]